MAKGDRIAMVTVDRAVAGGGAVAGAGLAAVEQRLLLGEARIGAAETQTAAERRQVDATLAAATAEAAQLTGQIALQKEAVASAQGLFTQIEGAVAKGFVSRFEFERRRQAPLSARQLLGTLTTQRLQALSRAEESRAQLAALAGAGAARLDDLRSGQLMLRQQQAELRGAQAYLLTAPVAGRVTALQTECPALSPVGHQPRSKPGQDAAAIAPMGD